MSEGRRLACDSIIRGEKEFNCIHALDSKGTHAHKVVDQESSQLHRSRIAERRQRRPVDEGTRWVVALGVAFQPAGARLTHQFKEAAHAHRVDIRPFAESKCVGIRVEPRLAPLGVTDSQGKEGVFAIRFAPIRVRPAIDAALIYPARDFGGSRDIGDDGTRTAKTWRAHVQGHGTANLGISSEAISSEFNVD